MSQREGHGPGGTTTAAPRPPESIGQRERLPRDAAQAAAPSWERLFPALSTSQQAELMALALRQGYLWSSQLPAPTHDGHLRPDAHARQVIADVLASRRLPTIQPIDLQPIDAALDPDQWLAVRGALASPDLFVIQGVCGTGKTRCSVELVRQVVRQGGRVLVVSSLTSPLDHLLQRLDQHADILAVRLAARDESLDRAAPNARNYLLEEREQDYQRRLTQDAGKQLIERESKLALMTTLPQIWDRLAEAIQRCDQLHANIQSTSTQLDELPTQMQALRDGTASTDPFHATLTNLLAERDHDQQLSQNQINDYQQQFEQTQSTLQQLAQEIGHLEPLAASRNLGQWWKPAFWKSRFSGDVLKDLEERQLQQTELQAKALELEQNIQAQRAAITARGEAYEQARQSALLAEEQRRLSDGQDQLQRLRDELARTEEGVRRLHQTAQAAGGGALTALTHEAVQQARQASIDLHESERAAIALTREWLTFADAHRDELLQRFRASINVVASPVSSLATVPTLFESGHIFDLLIVEESQFLADAEFQSAARLARKWVLLGEPTADHAATVDEHRPRGRHPGNRSRRRSHDLFHRLWQRLHSPVWLWEDGRLCCRLHAIPSEHRANLESESVADFPDVELRIHAPEHDEPRLAEVVFPPTMPLLQAKEYLFRELNEITLSPVGIPNWENHDGNWTCRWQPSLAQEVRIELDKGIHEVLSAEPGDISTRAIEFDHHQGWDRAEAEKWLMHHLLDAGRFSGRTAELTRLHRMCPELGHWMSEVVYSSIMATSPARCDRGALHPCVEFHPVPGFGDESRRRDRQPRREPSLRRIPVHLRGGAGLDIDLGDPRSRERVPADLQAAMPRAGFINVPEAQAMIRYLESIALHATETPISLGVTALYPAQVELIALLIQRSALAEAIRQVAQVIHPGDLAGREFDVVLVGLTRSHGNRAVTFGDDPRDTMRLFGRARNKLVLFGDPGTLTRRSQWEGPLDQLDARLGELERRWISQLVRYLHGQGEQPALFQLHEGLRL